MTSATSIPTTKHTFIKSPFWACINHHTYIIFVVNNQIQKKTTTWHTHLSKNPIAVSSVSQGKSFSFSFWFSFIISLLDQKIGPNRNKIRVFQVFQVFHIFCKGKGFRFRFRFHFRFSFSFSFRYFL